MFVKNHTLLKFLSAMFLTAVGATSVLAGDALKTSDADHSSLTEADKIYEESLLENNKNYPTVELRKSASNDCYCEGGYFGFSAGYAHAPSKSLIRIIPIVTNPGVFNNAILGYPVAGKHYTASVNAGYKFKNIRAEISGEYKDHQNYGFSNTIGTVTVNVRAKTKQIGAMMSGYYDFDLGMPISPYLGLGVGAYNAETSFMTDYIQAGTTTTGGLEFRKGFTFAGAAMVGASIQVSNNIILDAGYRYTNVKGGTATLSKIINAAAVSAAAGTLVINSGMGTSGTGSSLITERLEYPDIISHEIKLGARYRF